MFEKRRGRPSVAERIKIKNKLQLYYLQEVDVKTTAELADTNEKTVRKYFNMWNKKIKNLSDKSFFEKAQKQKQKAIMRFNYQISKLDAMSSIIENKIIQCDGSITKEFVPNMKLLLEIENMITTLTLHVTNIENSPTADVSLDQKAEELIKKYAQISK